MTVDPRIRDRRRALDLTMVDLAARAHVSLTFLHNVERGLLPRKSNALIRLNQTLTDLEKEKAA